MKLDRKTLTEQQRTLEKEFGVVHYITKDKKLGLKTNIQYETYLINTKFEKSIAQITNGYTQAEINSWNIKKNEAEKVIAGGKSSILTSMLVKGETTLQLAKKILTKAKIFEKTYFNAEKVKRDSLLNINKIVLQKNILSKPQKAPKI